MITALTNDPAVFGALTGVMGGRPSLVQARSWERLEWLVHERPVTGVVLDSDALGDGLPADERVVHLLRRFPSLATVLVARPQLDPVTLFHLGKSGLSDLVLIPADDLEVGVRRSVGRASGRNTQSLVLRSIGRAIPSLEREVVRFALDGALLGWHADDLADSSGFTRAHLSFRLRDVGLPSVGHLLLWSKLLHAGRWLSDPGRSAESVARQLEYSNGAAFRRALRNYVGKTPSEVRDEGGLRVVLRSFLDVCGLEFSLPGERFVA